VTTAFDRSAVRCTPAELLDVGRDGFTLLSHGDPGTPVVVLELDGADWSGDLVHAVTATLDVPGPVVIGNASDQLPEAVRPVLERLTFTRAPSGPGRAWIPADEHELSRICAHVATAPGAAVALHGLLRATAHLPVPEAILAEAATYSMLLGGEEFATWRAATPPRPVPAVADPVRLARVGGDLRITLDHPKRRNAFGASMRDALVDALRLAVLDDTIGRIELRGSGPVFCSGGDLDEFGTARSPVAAYLTRLSRNPGHLAHQLAERLTVHLHGAAVGAGIELAAFAGRVTATDDTWVQLPELRLGLVPGAGGTVSIPRRIGRWRTAWMVLSGARLDAGTALDWGLVDEIV